MTRHLLITAATVILGANAALAHPGDHSLALKAAAQHFATSPWHLPALMLVGAALAGLFAWRFAASAGRSATSPAAQGRESRARRARS